MHKHDLSGFVTKIQVDILKKSTNLSLGRCLKKVSRFKMRSVNMTNTKTKLSVQNVEEMKMVYFHKFTFSPFSLMYILFRYAAPVILFNVKKAGVKSPLFIEKLDQINEESIIVHCSIFLGF